MIIEFEDNIEKLKNKIINIIGDAFKQVVVLLLLKLNN